MSSVKYYPPAEERLNVASHGLGVLLSLVGLPLLLFSPSASESWLHWSGKLVFGLSMLVLYVASTCYHMTTTDTMRQRMRVVDHAAIYVMIAGTYTPFMVISLKGTLGLSILITVWLMAVMGVTLKLFFTGRFSLLSTLLYVLMGWGIVLFIQPLSAQLDAAGLQWLIAGGVFYTVGALLYAIKAIPYNHALFHVFVLLGSFCHFICVFKYI